MIKFKDKVGDVTMEVTVPEGAIYPIDVVSRIYIENEMLKKIVNTTLNDERVPEEYKEYIVEHMGKEHFYLGDKPWGWKGVL